MSNIKSIGCVVIPRKLRKYKSRCFNFSGILSQGDRGPQGLNGKNGPSGQQGPAGADGSPGLPGNDGETVSFKISRNAVTVKMSVNDDGIKLKQILL